MTLKELYARAKNAPKTVAPGQAFINEVASVAKKSEIAVRRWLGGKAVPDALTQEVLAKHFNTTPDKLFPSNESS